MFRNRLQLAFLCVVVSTISTFENETRAQGFNVPNFPRSSVRGKIHIRNGLFRTYREHWGNGVTDNGLALGTNFINGAVAVAPIVAAAATGNPFSNTSGQLGADNDGLGACPPISAPVPLDPQSEKRQELLTGIKTRQEALLSVLGVGDEEMKKHSERWDSLLSAGDSTIGGKNDAGNGEDQISGQI